LESIARSEGDVCTTIRDPLAEGERRTVAVLPRGRGRRAVLGSLALAAIGTPLAIAQPWASAGPTTKPGGPLWLPDVHKDGLRAFEGIEADRAHRHPDRKGKYVVVEQDHWRFNIWRDDRDTTGGGDRQRTEVRGMVSNGRPVKMLDGETWKLAYDMFIPASLHGTSRFTHIFQTKAPTSSDAGPWVTLSLTRSGSTELIRLQADSTRGNPSIAAHELAPLHERWVTVEITLRPGDKGSAGLVLKFATDGRPAASSIITTGTRSNLRIPDRDTYVRPKWGIYRSLRSAPADLQDTYLLLRNFSATKLG
jgi:hypothetical protein